jgi:hypothetical protein
MRELEIHPMDGRFIVNETGTRLTITFQISPKAQRLIEDQFWTRDEGIAKFRQDALELATATAHELGWICGLKNVA